MLRFTWWRALLIVAVIALVAIWTPFKYQERPTPRAGPSLPFSGPAPREGTLLLNVLTWSDSAKRVTAAEQEFKKRFQGSHVLEQVPPLEVHRSALFWGALGLIVVVGIVLVANDL